MDFVFDWLLVVCFARDLEGWIVGSLHFWELAVHSHIALQKVTSPHIITLTMRDEVLGSVAWCMNQSKFALVLSFAHTGRCPRCWCCWSVVFELFEMISKRHCDHPHMESLVYSSKGLWWPYGLENIKHVTDDYVVVVNSIWVVPSNALLHFKTLQ